MDINTYKEELNKEFNRILQLMGKEWGEAPKVNVHVEPMVLVTADFNMKGFAHKGQKVYVRNSAAISYRKPKLVARQIGREILSHRNTCNECGEPAAPLWQRIRYAKRILGKQTPHWSYLEDPNTWYDSKKRRKLKLKLLVDPVEAVLFPRATQLFKKAIEKKGTKKNAKESKDNCVLRRRVKVS